MADERLRLIVLTPASSLLDMDGLDWVQVVLADGGGLGIYPGHAPLLAETWPGVLRYAIGGQAQQTAPLAAGVLDIHNNQVQLLTGGPIDDEIQAGQSDSASEEALPSDRLAAALWAALQTPPTAFEDTDGQRKT